MLCIWEKTTNWFIIIRVSEFKISCGSLKDECRKLASVAGFYRSVCKGLHSPKPDLLSKKSCSLYDFLMPVEYKFNNFCLVFLWKNNTVSFKEDACFMCQYQVRSTLKENIEWRFVSIITIGIPFINDDNSHCNGILLDVV